MNVFIKELEDKDDLGRISSLPTFFKKIIIKTVEITNYFFYISIDENNKKYIIPNVNRKKVYKNVFLKIKKEQRITRNNQQIILSNALKKYKSEFKNLKIVDGKNLLLKNMDKIIEKIIPNIPIERVDLFILTNNYNSLNVNFIKNIAYKVKTINIITKEVDKYKTLEEILLENGIAINVSNNKKKSLKKAVIIINLDYSKEDLVKYNINRNGCIINVNKDIMLDDQKGFEGIIINDVDLIFEVEIQDFIHTNNLNVFKSIELMQTLSYINNENPKFEISNLYGNNGKINKKELLNIEKILTN